ncbi:hypothetical protein BGX34_008886 [Mortierella sp. NVP85]|nr:hypothetical protein BGX34_008886 [Mortierella sp. NVP85]
MADESGIRTTGARLIDLNGEWQLSNKDRSVLVKATVPGQVHVDLMRANILQDDPYYGTNYVKDSMRKIIEDTWVFEKEFILQEDQVYTTAMLVCEGLDTIARVTLNGVQIGFTNNQFRRYLFDVGSSLKTGLNVLTIEFEDAVKLAKTKAEAYPYYVQVDLVSHTRQKLTLKYGSHDGLSVPEHQFVTNAGVTDVEHSFVLEKSHVQQWWPRGYGDPVLYTLDATLLNEDGLKVGSHVFRCGFRTCELDQDPMEGQSGAAFKFRVNGEDVFAKGTNWIPGHVFDQLMTMGMKRSILESCVAANMNMIRIWGGGRYETDEFYQLCDELGIMVWQEFMFACALYPTDGAFLENVKQEVSDQVKRLMVHPSIVLWSGNNENQEFMVKGWDEATVKNPYIFTVDYHKLYVETIMKTLHTLDTSRPFISTSPSAGVISMDPYTERYILQESERGLFGDVHFYDYKHNGLHVENYPNARFVSEYGAQSMPSFKSWRKVSSLDDWHPLSRLSVHRNHHGNGQPEMLAQIEYQFRLPATLSKYLNSDPETMPDVPAETRERLFDTFCYLTQCVQARSITGQTEHYIRGRGEVYRTMGALYWQLNDIWPAPTWSSIEHGGRWKPLHYYMQHSFADILVSGYQAAGERSFHIHISNDKAVPISGELRVRSYRFRSGEFKTQAPIPYSVDGRTSRCVASVTDNLFGNDETLEPQLLLAEAVVRTPDATETFEMLPQTFPVRDAFPLDCLQCNPVIAIKQFEVLRDVPEATYLVRIVLQSSAIAGLVWLEWAKDEIEGHFSSNSFWLLPGEPREIVFFGRTDASDIQEEDLQMRSLWDTLAQ